MSVAYQVAARLTFASAFEGPEWPEFIHRPIQAVDFIYGPMRIIRGKALHGQTCSVSLDDGSIELADPLMEDCHCRTSVK